MTAIHSIGPRASSSSSQDSESLLQHGYFIAAAVIIIALIIIRIFVLRWRHQPVYDFFRIGTGSRYATDSHPPEILSHGSTYRGAQLAPLPAAYRSGRGVHAADTDAHGRRLNPSGEGWEGKDALPAYDSLDRPPKYIEASRSHWGDPGLMGHSAVIPFSEGERSGTAQSNTVSGEPGHSSDQQPDNTHAMAGPAIHHDLSSS